MPAPQSYSWMPDWLRKFLNLDGEMPTYRSSSDATNAPATRSAPSYTPSQQNATGHTPTPPSYAPAQPSWQPVRMDDGQGLSFNKPPRTKNEGTSEEDSTEQSEPERVRFVGPTSGAEPPSRLDANGNIVPVEGYVQPVSYMLRGFVRGALPPQGLEQFTREVRATTTDVWNFYSYWTRFQTDDFVRFGRGVVTSIIESLPSPDALSAPHSGRIRRAIKVNAPNGNGHHGHGDKKDKEAEEE
ncbi:MAG: hypothetical protein EI684_08875 [Candidatus Viridilinea halotolerans]|uniref:Uncharacterized protein n=1 Tax=Candidatus Viridilinea halotolerans TaxID=2491704 RepID=A0A426U1L8_9CHLR|nr:MAG: hypothetical protein EI684_08875 [Candidatus Viridilinea halotolerans]